MLLVSQSNFTHASGRQRVLHVKLAAARNWPINTKLHLRHPTPHVVVAFVDVDGERSDLNGILSDGGLILSR